jgi:hypothetical protein
MYQLHERPIEGKVSIIAPTVGLTAADIQKADLLLAGLYDASLCAERITMKLDCVATALRRQFISYDSAVEWLFRLGLLDYVDPEQIRQEGPPMTAAQSTYDALLWELREYGVHRLKHRPTQRRLSELSTQQVQDLTAALRRLQATYPRTCTNQLIAVIGKISK